VYELLLSHSRMLFSCPRHVGLPRYIGLVPGPKYPPDNGTALKRNIKCNIKNSKLKQNPSFFCLQIKFQGGIKQDIANHTVKQINIDSYTNIV